MLDSCSYVFKGIVELRKRGAFARLIMKHWFWSAWNSNWLALEGKVVGESNAISGKLDWMKYFIGGRRSLIRSLKSWPVEVHCFWITTVEQFQGSGLMVMVKTSKMYIRKTFDWHFHYCHIITDHNILHCTSLVGGDLDHHSMGSLCIHFLAGIQLISHHEVFVWNTQGVNSGTYCDFWHKLSWESI